MERVEKLLKIEFDNKPIYGDGDKYIKTKWKYMVLVWIKIFKTRKCQNKKHHAIVDQ